ncbi:hypothetical protein ACJX0J_028425, partial [Zea mays]
MEEGMMEDKLNILIPIATIDENVTETHKLKSQGGLLVASLHLMEILNLVWLHRNVEIIEGDDLINYIIITGKKVNRSNTTLTQKKPRSLRFVLEALGDDAVSFGLFKNPSHCDISIAHHNAIEPNRHTKIPLPEQMVRGGGGGGTENLQPCGARMCIIHSDVYFLNSGITRMLTKRM